MKLLEYVYQMICDAGYRIGNVDATIIAQRPKLRPYIEEMERNIAKVLQVEVTQINVKATTEEHLGFTGRMEGISTQAICCLVKDR